MEGSVVLDRHNSIHTWAPGNPVDTYSVAHIQPLEEGAVADYNVAGIVVGAVVVAAVDSVFVAVAGSVCPGGTAVGLTEKC